MQTLRTSGTFREPGLLLAAAFAAFLTGWAWPVLAQFPDIDSSAECPGCRAALDSLAEPAADARPALAGTWSSPLTLTDDPAWRLEDFLCFLACTPNARAAATALANTPAGSRPTTTVLLRQIIGIDLRDTLSLLKAGPPNAIGPRPGTSTTSSSGLVAPAAFLSGLPTAPTCDPPGFPTQVVSPLPLKIERRAGRIVFHYESFDIARTILFDGRGDPSADASLPFGLSRGRLEGNAFVVETTDIPPGRFYAWFGGGPYSDKLHAIEQYTTSDGGRWLNLRLQLEDSETLKAPLILLKRWRRAPALDLLPYSCDAISGQR